MKTEYTTKEKTSITKTPVVATVDKKHLPAPPCILCSRTNTGIKEFTTKGMVGEHKVRQVICHEGNCGYIATYVDGKLV
jgi:hypothetical protein